MKLSPMMGAVLVLALSQPLAGQAVFPEENGKALERVLAFDAKVLVQCSQSLFRFADHGDDGLCRGGPDKGCGVIVSAIDVVVDRLD